MICALLALVGCVATEPSTVALPTPAAAPVPLGDTGLPALAVTPPPPFDVVIGPPVLCTDPGRDSHFYDRVLLGPDITGSEPRQWVGAGLAIDDFDADGSLDIFAAGVDRPVYWTRTAETWEERAAVVFTPPVPPESVGASVADYDGDGDPDLFVTMYGKSNLLYRNDGGLFTEVGAQAGVAGHTLRSTSSSWADLDGDGDLDLVVGNYGPRPPDAWDPEMQPGDPSEVYLNNGDGTFADHSDALPQAVHDAYTFMIGLHDVDGDGLPELFTVADFGWVRPSKLLWNRGAGVFEADDGTANFHPNFAGMGLGVGDLNGDGIPDFSQSSYEEISLLQSGISSFSTSGIAWAEFSDALGIAAQPESNHFFGWGTDLGDLDNDGDLDLVVGFGHWDEYGNPDLQFDGVWVQDEAGFTNRSSYSRWALDDAGPTRGVLLVDLDRDGYLDIVKRILRRPVIVQQSRCAPSVHWLSVEVRDDRTANRRAIGARVEVFAGTNRQIRWQTAGSSSMFSGGPPETHFGLANRLSVDRIRVGYPDGESFEINDVPTNRRVTITRQAL